MIRLGGPRLARPAAVGGVFNIGHGEEISIGALAERIRGLCDSASSIVNVPYDVAYQAGFEDMPRRVPDISKIRALIGYEPRVGLEEMLREVVLEHLRRREVREPVGAARGLPVALHPA